LNNQRRRTYRRLLSIGSGIVFFFAVLAGLGIEFSFYNHYNPLFNPGLMVAFSFGFFLLRTYIKDKKETTTALLYFGKAGDTEIYDIAPSEEDATHIKYEDEKGEIISVKHSHPLLVATDDGYERWYLVPKKGRKSLDPTALVAKYGQVITKEQIKQLNVNITESEFKVLEDVSKRSADIISKVVPQIPEIEAINPDLVSNDMTEQDEPDTLFEEFTHHVAEIRRAVQDLLGNKTSLTQIIMYAGSGALVMLILMILGHADFSRVGG
jgi:hypothetical protein